MLFVLLLSLVFAKLIVRPSTMTKTKTIRFDRTNVDAGAFWKAFLIPTATGRMVGCICWIMCSECPSSLLSPPHGLFCGSTPGEILVMSWKVVVQDTKKMEN